MCQFFSAIAMPDGSVLWHEMTDSHEHLIDHFGLNDDKVGRFARVEFRPDDNKGLTDLDKYTLRLDECEAPDWWERVKDGVTARCRAILSDRILTSGRHRTLLGGPWVLGGDVVVDQVVNARIITMRGSSRVGTMWGSSQVGEMGGSSQVGAMGGSSRIIEDRRLKE